jgi:branched-chain amino acid transport system substrate-binding protein
MLVKRRMLAAVAAFALMGVLAACGSDDEGGGGGAEGTANKDPLRIALIPPSSGALATFGKDAAEAWQFAADEANAAGGVNGHKVELIKSSTDAQPASTVRAARKAVTQDKAQYIGAVMTSPEHGALQQQLASMNAVSINALGKDDALTGEGCSPNAYRAVQSNLMDVKAIAQSLSELPAERWAIQAVDYSTGHAAAKEFKAAAEAAGKTVVFEQYAPLNTTEFGSYITKLKNADADGLFAVEYGADGVAFVNQGDQFKLFDKYKTVLGFNMVSEPLFPAIGDKSVGFFNNLGYNVADDNPKNKAFVDAWTKKFGAAPYYVEADNYLAAQVLFEAVKKAGTVDPAKVRTALDTVSFDSFVGPVSMAPDHQLTRATYVGKIVKKGGDFGWEIVAEAPGEEIHPEPNPDCKL